MLDFSISGGQLMLIWAFAGAICCLPFFIKKRWQYFVTVPIIFLSIYISFITNYEFIGKPLYERPPSKFVYQYHSVTVSYTHLPSPRDGRISRMPSSA